MLGTRRSLTAFRGTRLCLTALLALATSSCVATSGSVLERTNIRLLAFENATIDEVAVYIDDHGSEWLLGQVQPGRTARLHLPDYVTGHRSEEVTVVVVPLGTRRDGLRGGEITGAIRSEVELSESLATRRWTLRGGRLVSVPLLGGRQ